MPDLYVQRDQPPGVPPLSLTGERTLPDVPEENYWFRRHLVVYEWIARRVHGPRGAALARGRGARPPPLGRAGRPVGRGATEPHALPLPRLQSTALPVPPPP